MVTTAWRFCVGFVEIALEGTRFLFLNEVVQVGSHIWDFYAYCCSWILDKCHAWLAHLTSQSAVFKFRSGGIFFVTNFLEIILYVHLSASGIRVDRVLCCLWPACVINLALQVWEAGLSLTKKWVAGSFKRESLRRRAWETLVAFVVCRARLAWTSTHTNAVITVWA